jgi:DNA-directed RNA polymerase subunit RPC12/RpoP
MKCNNCGKEIPFDEFLEAFDSAHQLSVSDKDTLRDANADEYYEGWAIWANYMHIKCPVCESSNWSDIVIDGVPNAEQTKKDEL